MAVFKCDLVNKRVRANTINDGQPTVFTATINLPVGVEITAADEVEISDVAYGHNISSMRVYTDKMDDATTLTWDIGNKQLAPGTGYGGVNASGVATDFDMATGNTFASPATVGDSIATAATFGRTAGWSSVTVKAQTAEGFAGPVRLVAKVNVTPTQVTSAASARKVRFEFTLARATPIARNEIDRGGY